MREALLLGGWFCGVGGAPAIGGYDLVGERGAGAGGFTGFSGIEGAVFTDLLGFVLRILFTIHFGGVLFVAEGLCDGVVFGEFDGWVGGEGTAGEQGGGSGGGGEFEQEVAAGVHGDGCLVWSV